jgi:hypothetical protein
MNMVAIGGWATMNLHTLTYETVSNPSWSLILLIIGIATAIGSCATGGGVGGFCWGEGRLDPELLRLEQPAELT